MSEIGMEPKRRLSGVTGKRSVRWGVIAIVVLLLIYYPLGMLWIHTVDDDFSFRPEGRDAAPVGGSQAVAMSAGLINREISTHRWTANDPFFVPSALLDNMPNFQQGLISALARFAFELTDQIGRTRGSSQTDPDLQEAAGLLQYSGTKWVWDPTVSLMPTAASEKQYAKARQSLLAYNERLASGSAVFEKRGDNLMATLDRIALDIGATTATLDRHIAEEAGGWIDFRADDIFYGAKGQLYGYTMILTALGDDFGKLIRERELEGAWTQMLDSMHKAAALDPWVVINGGVDSIILHNHLASMGFYVLRARTQLREITNILLK